MFAGVGYARPWDVPFCVFGPCWAWKLDEKCSLGVGGVSYLNDHVLNAVVDVCKCVHKLAFQGCESAID